MFKDKVIPVLWLMMAAIIIGASIGFAVRAEAAPEDEVAVAICERYDITGPTKAATMALALQMFDAGLDSDQAAELFTLAVVGYCPEYLQEVVAIMDDFSNGDFG